MRTLRRSAPVLALLLLGACSQDAANELHPESEIFRGLDPAVVKEVLGHPGVMSAISGVTGSARSAAAQYNAASFTTCRDLHEAYSTWLRTGTRPAQVHSARPTTPIEGNAEGFERDDAYYAEIWSENDPSQLRSYLIDPMGCGDWTPVTPGDHAGPTIRTTLDGRS